MRWKRSSGKNALQPWHHRVPGGGVDPGGPSGWDSFRGIVCASPRRTMCAACCHRDRPGGTRPGWSRRKCAIRWCSFEHTRHVAGNRPSVFRRGGRGRLPHHKHGVPSGFGFGPDVPAGFGLGRRELYADCFSRHGRQVRDVSVAGAFPHRTHNPAAARSSTRRFAARRVSSRQPSHRFRPGLIGLHPQFGQMPSAIRSR